MAFSAKYISRQKCHTRSGINSDFGFLLETSAVGFWRFPDNPSLTDRTVDNYRNKILFFTFGLSVDNSVMFYFWS